MKIKIVAMLVLAVLSTALADKHEDDYRQFEKWLYRVHESAPRYNLKLHWGAPDETEFFYLYCWQSDDHTIAPAIRKAKKVWARTK